MAHSPEERGREVKHHMREGKTNAQSRKIKKYNEKSDESSHVDLAPMVDIAFLLLTFFMMTTSFSKPNVFQMGLPEDSKPGGSSETPVNQLYILTVYITKTGNVFMVRGIEGDNNKPELVQADKIEEKAKTYRAAVQNDPANTTKSDIVTVVKIDPNTGYGNMIYALDEIYNGGITRWATVQMKTDESDKINLFEASLTSK